MQLQPSRAVTRVVFVGLCISTHVCATDHDPFETTGNTGNSTETGTETETDSGGSFWETLAMIVQGVLAMIIDDNEPRGMDMWNTTFEDCFDGNCTTLTAHAIVHAGQSDMPGVLVVHDWNGADEFEMRKAHKLARELSYNVLVADVYGARGYSMQENMALMGPLVAGDRSNLHRRLQLNLDQLAMITGGPRAAIGFCFGGLSVLDMARTGMDVAGVVSFHGGLAPLPDVNPADMPPIGAKVLVLTGYEDPSIPPAHVAAFQAEMTARDADWQVHVYGNGTLHAFTRPGPPGGGSAYSKAADRRSWDAMRGFLDEVFYPRKPPPPPDEGGEGQGPMYRK